MKSAQCERLSRGRISSFKLTDVVNTGNLGKVEICLAVKIGSDLVRVSAVASVEI